MIITLCSVAQPMIYRAITKYYSSGSSKSLVSLECQSRNSIPTNVTWSRNHMILDTEDETYQTIGSVNTWYRLRHSYFRSTLRVHSLTGALGTQKYTCFIENAFGSDSESITLQREGMASITKTKGF